MKRFRFSLAALLITVSVVCVALGLILGLNLIGVLIFFAVGLPWSISRPKLLRLWIVFAAGVGTWLAGWGWLQMKAGVSYHEFTSGYLFKWGYVPTAEVFGVGTALLAGAVAAYFTFVRRPPPEGPETPAS